MCADDTLLISLLFHTGVRFVKDNSDAGSTPIRGFSSNIPPVHRSEDAPDEEDGDCNVESTAVLFGVFGQLHTPRDAAGKAEYTAYVYRPMTVSPTAFSKLCHSNTIYEVLDITMVCLMDFSYVTLN
ncbi:hypothetical protein JR316_0005508 [Psilocybe cubensis]|uniref:Uncharacterized protein n=1 Tax=Psilocybe cubensis TaxID=181762 RepID=A0ACB8GZS0_PSICU|nr:hypothetical protein JR316_0005508 [Psilocybe cubensis]KAH9480990.1 hypothetical protein JR316_0005508 [Psilocybe cubensis]